MGNGDSASIGLKGIHCPPARACLEKMPVSLPSDIRAGGEQQRCQAKLTELCIHSGQAVSRAVLVGTQRGIAQRSGVPSLARGAMEGVEKDDEKDEE